jgi:hypothetical protein
VSVINLPLFPPGGKITRIIVVRQAGRIPRIGLSLLSLNRSFIDLYHKFKRRRGAPVEILIPTYEFFRDSNRLLFSGEADLFVPSADASIRSTPITAAASC